jgi:type II secretory pathway pseudopilin PulG
MYSHKHSNQGFTLFELIIVFIVISAIVTVGVKYYSQMVNESQKAGVELLSNRFAAVTALLHAQWIIESRPEAIALDGYHILFDTSGWPKNAAGSTDKFDDFENQGHPSQECYNLWHSLLQNPSRLSLGEGLPGFKYQASGDAKQGCLYRLITKGSENYYFKYYPSNGKVITHLGEPN